MKYLRHCLTALTVTAAFATTDSMAQTLIGEDFTGQITKNSWYFFNGACLTAGTTSGSSPGSPPGCVVDSYYSENLVGGQNGVAGNAQTLPDPNGFGALRFTNGCIANGTGGCGSGGHNQNGAIISAKTFGTGAGVQVTFKTMTYRGDSNGNGQSGVYNAHDGADGMSFFLMDGAVDITNTSIPHLGAFGGSLGYTCSNANSPHDGMVGAYLGLGIDEFGNFLNGSANTQGTTANATGDNTATGGGQWANRIGMRGAGNVSWYWLSTTYPAYYGIAAYATGANQQAAVQNTCRNGYLSDYNNNAITSGTGATIPVLDYAAIPNAYKVLTGVTIGNEYANGGYSRGDANPIQYKLKITQDGLLSLDYSYNGGAYQNVLTNQSITASNGTLPASFRFGFAGSTGGATNIHEVLCFQAAPASQSASSSAANEKQSAQVQTGTQAFFAFYDPNDWTGRLTAYGLSASSNGALTIAAAANWDASCVLTGVASGSACQTTGVNGPTNAQSPANRTIFTYNGGGVPFEFGSLSAAQQATLNLNDATSNANRLNFLRGDRSNEIGGSAGTNLFRVRDGLLGDIIDSSPTFVGPPTSPYAMTWRDRLYTGSAPENSGTTYTQFTANNATRTNVVYVGANDGMLHGFRSGSFTAAGNFVGTNNDGLEVMAYVPGSVIQSAGTTGGGCTNTDATSSVVQNIHGESPALGAFAACTNATLDFSNRQYGHNYFVDATPGTGDLFYQNGWHTWLVSGLGAGGQGLFALDITTPSNFTETTAAAANTVIGEWTSATITCTNVANCGNNLGSTYGTPVIRRLHNGQWAAIFGNGFGSTSGDAGIYIMTVDPSSAATTFYYLSTGVGSAGTPNGIAYVTAADLDGDHITDYVYAGDLLGNVWRFDLTSQVPLAMGTGWAAGAAPLFTTASGQPITTQVVVAIVLGNLPTQQVMVAFGTGQKFGLTNTAATTYASAPQSIYAVWDWNLSNWNSRSLSQFASLAATPGATGLSAPFTVPASRLQAQILTIDAQGNRTASTTAVCWQGQSNCGAGANVKFGWSVALPAGSEQIVFNPQLLSTALLVNSVIPANNSLTSCTVNVDKGVTYALSIATGGLVPGFFNTYPNDVGINTGATGSNTILTTTGTIVGSSSSGSSSSGSSSSGGSSTSSGGGSCNVSRGNNTWLVYQTVTGTPSATQVVPLCGLHGARQTWIQTR